MGNHYYLGIIWEIWLTGVTQNADDESLAGCEAGQSLLPDANLGYRRNSICVRLR
ncbi:hypothetical protein [Pseudanabaena sp. UWO311]|uniref:hypothetical protein n=1 Tax=Pseudanabaena sp. UWO311 TaxID=2487337 RepID=UPI0030DDB2BF